MTTTTTGPLDAEALESFTAWSATPDRWEQLPEPRCPEIVVHHVRELPDHVVLGLIDQLSRTVYWPGGSSPHWVFVSDLAGALRLLGYRAHHGVNEMPSGYVLAKARRLIERGLITGCGCGCRGDFEITETGRVHLEGAA